MRTPLSAGALPPKLIIELQASLQGIHGLEDLSANDFVSDSQSLRWMQEIPVSKRGRVQSCRRFMSVRFREILPEKPSAYSRSATIKLSSLNMYTRIDMPVETTKNMLCVQGG